MYRLTTTGGCTPGPDAEPAGLDVATDVPQLPERNPKLQCEPSSGRAVQVVSARAADVPDRYDDFADSIRQWAGQVDRTVRNLAAGQGGERHVRFVQDADCAVEFENAVLDPAADDTFAATVAELRARNLLDRARKYLVFVDANVYCGIAEMEDDDRASRSNLNNTACSARCSCPLRTRTATGSARGTAPARTTST